MFGGCTLTSSILYIQIYCIEMSEFKTFLFQKSEAEPTYYELGIRGQFGIEKEKIYTEHFEADLKSFKKIMGENRAITNWVKMWNKNWSGDSLSFVNIDVLKRVWKDRNNRGWPQWLRTKCRNGFIKHTITTWHKIVNFDPSMLVRLRLYFGDLKTNISHIIAFVSFFHDNYSILVEQLKKKQSSGGTMPSILNFPLQHDTPETYALATSNCIVACIFLLGHDLQDAEGLFDNDLQDAEGGAELIAAGAGMYALYNIQSIMRLIHAIVVTMPGPSITVFLGMILAEWYYEDIMNYFYGQENRRRRRRPRQ